LYVVIYTKYFILNTKYKNEMKGFTILELLLVIGAAIVIAALTVPVGVRFFQTQTLDEATSGIMETMRRAHNQAVFQKNDSAFGVKFLSGSYVLFQGNSYDTRTQSEDESFEVSSGIATSGIDEVVFAKLTGIPNTTGTLTVTSGSDSQTININAHGKVER
jgi:type II secretory pathway pseudopilin PulG